MTNEEILEAEKVIDDAITGMRDYLSLIAGITDVEKLIPLVLNKPKPTFFTRFNGAMSVVDLIYPKLSIWKSEDAYALYIGVDSLKSPAVGMELLPHRADEFKKMLMERKSEGVPRALAALDKLAEALKELKLQQPPNQAIQPTPSPRNSLTFG